MQVVVKKFYKAYIDLFTKLSGYFSQLKDVPTSHEEYFTKDNNTITPSSQTTVDFLRLFDAHYQVITGLDEYKAFKKSITEDMTDSAGNKLMNTGDSWLVNNFCRYTCMRLHERSNRTFHFDQQAAYSLYADMERYLLCDELIYHEKCMLRNFESKVGTIELDGKIKIVRASDKEFQQLFRLQGRMGLLPFDFFKDVYFIQSETKRSKKEPMVIGKKRALFQDVRLALLLFKDRLVALGHTVVTEAGGFDYLGGLSFAGAIDTSPVVLGVRYTLDAKESEDFKMFYKMVTKNLKKSFLRRAADRFVTAVYNRPYEERLIDFIIALECLYLPGIRTESSFRLSRRAARLIANTTGAEFEEVYDDLKLGIQLRNTLVHGEDPSKEIKTIKQKHKSLHDFVKRMDAYMRESLSYFLRNPKKRSDLFFRRLELSLDS